MMLIRVRVSVEESKAIRSYCHHNNVSRGCLAAHAMTWRLTHRDAPTVALPATSAHSPMIVFSWGSSMQGEALDLFECLQFMSPEHVRSARQLIRATVIEYLTFGER